MSADGNVSLRSSETYVINREGGVLSAGGNVSLTSDADHIANHAGGTISAGNDVIAVAATNANNRGEILAAGSVNYTAANQLNNYGVIDATGDINLTAVDDFVHNRPEGVITAGGNIELSAGRHITNGLDGVIEAGGDLFAEALGTTFNNYGAVTVVGDATITAAGNVNLAADTSFTVGRVADFTAGARVNDFGALNAGAIAFTADRVDTRRDDNYTLNGFVEANSYVALVGGSFNVTEGSVLDISDAEQANDINIQAGGLISNAGVLNTDGTAFLQLSLIHI